MSQKKYWIETYGCQMNKAESESLILQLNELGMTEAPGSDEADLVILNTCSVRKTAEDRVWGRIGHYKGQKGRNPELKIALTGCMAQRLKDELSDVDIVIGNFQKHKLKEIILEAYNNDTGLVTADSEEYQFSTLHSAGDFKAFIPIMHGCNNYCSYCIVPYVRGPEVSRDPESILLEIEKLEAGNVFEITLLGQNVNSYRYEKDGKTILFPDLLEMIAEKVSQIRWVRFMTSHPKDLSDRLIEVIKENPIFCRHIHLPVQHGSNKILKVMRRVYTRESYLELIEKIRSRIPGVSLTTDILIGFPGEDEEDYQATVDMIKTVGFNDAFTYKYNPREGTKAFEMEDTVPDDLKLKRLGAIIELQRKIQYDLKKAMIGKVLPVLVEKVSRKDASELLGRTEQDSMVVFPGKENLIGRFILVEIKSVKGNTFKGKVV